MATLPLPATAIASSSTDVLVATGTALHLVSGSGSSSFSVTPENAGAVPAATVCKAALNADGSLAVTAGDDKSLRVWDVANNAELKLRSMRSTIKKVAAIEFASDNSIVLTDKVGDVYQYPLDPRPTPADADRPKGFLLSADPSLNPDADYLLGHVSVVSQHVLTPDGKHIITADRDEHIRVSRFPKAYVVDRYLFGSEGFVSAIHVPTARPSTLLSAGGESTLQIWDWTTGALIRRVEIWPSILPHRRVRPPARRLKNLKRKAVNAAKTGGPEPSDDPTAEGWFTAPEGQILPLGQGVCVEAIGSAVVGDKVVGVFFSEGCAALHAFSIDDADKGVETLSLPYPVLGFTSVPGSPSQVAVTLDTSFGVAKGDTEIDAGRTQHSVVIVDVAADGKMTEITATSPLAAPLLTAISTSIPAASAQTLAHLGAGLYPNLALFPRWPGFEEDEELAGPGVNTPEGKAELESMNSKQLGRLKARGEDVQDLLPKKKKRKGAKAGSGKETAEVTPETEVATGDAVPVEGDEEAVVNVA